MDSLEMLAAVNEVADDFNRYVTASTAEITSVTTSTEPFTQGDFYGDDPVPTIHIGFRDTGGLASGGPGPSVNCEYDEAHLGIKNLDLYSWQYGLPEDGGQEYYDSLQDDASSRRYFRLVVLHELMHTFGLAHSDSSYAMMNYGARPWFDANTIRPLPDDVNGLRELYPQPNVGASEVAVFNSWWTLAGAEYGAAQQQPYCDPSLGDVMGQRHVRGQVRHRRPDAGSTEICSGSDLHTRFTISNYSTEEADVTARLWLSRDDRWDSSRPPLADAARVQPGRSRLRSRGGDLRAAEPRLRRGRVPPDHPGPGHHRRRALDRGLDAAARHRRVRLQQLRRGDSGRPRDRPGRPAEPLAPTARASRLRPRRAVRPPGGPRARRGARAARRRCGGRRTSAARLVGRGDGPHGHPGGAAGGDARRRVLQDDAVRGGDAEPLRAQQVGIGRGLAAVDHVGRHEHGRLGQAGGGEPRAGEAHRARGHDGHRGQREHAAAPGMATTPSVSVTSASSNACVSSSTRSGGTTVLSTSRAGTAVVGLGDGAAVHAQPRAPALPGPDHRRRRVDQDAVEVGEDGDHAATAARRGGRRAGRAGRPPGEDEHDERAEHERRRAPTAATPRRPARR